MSLSLFLLLFNLLFLPYISHALRFLFQILHAFIHFIHIFLSSFSLLSFLLFGQFNTFIPTSNRQRVAKYTTIKQRHTSACKLTHARMHIHTPNNAKKNKNIHIKNVYIRPFTNTLSLTDPTRKTLEYMDLFSETTT